MDRNKNGKCDPLEKWRDDDGNNAYTPRLTKELALARFTKDLVVANESYAQVGVRLVAGVSKVITAPATIANGEAHVRGNETTKEADLTATEKALVLGGFNSANADDIEAYYVAKVDLETNGAMQRGWSFPASYYKNMTTAGVNDSLLVTNYAGYYTLGHELGHILTQTQIHLLNPNLVAITSEDTLKVIQASDAKIEDDKRLTSDQEKDIQKSKYAKAPT